MLLDDIRSYLNSLSLVSSAWPLYEGYIPDDQSQMQAVFETGGKPPTELGIGSSPRPTLRVTFQMRVRSNRLDYVTGRTQWKACFDALQDSNLGNAGLYVLVQTIHNGPITFNDDKGRPNFISNFNVMMLNV